MAFERKKLRLRRYEVQAHYHSAYLYLNLKGLLAERWGHGPYFNAFGGGGNDVRITDGGDGGEATKVGVYGLKTSAFLWEGAPDRKDAQKLATEWLSD